MEKMRFYKLMMLKDVFWLRKTPEFWSRISAKIIDYCLFYISTTFISLFLPFYIDEFYYYIFAIFLPLFWIPIEAFFISKFATTVGKKIFGLQVRNHLGGRLPYIISLKRSWVFGIRPGVIKQKAILTGRKILGHLLACSMIFGAIYEQELSDYSTGYGKSEGLEGWVPYSSQDGKFSVFFPDDPKQESHAISLPDQNRVLQYNELTSYHEKKVSYSVSYMQIPKKWKLAGASRILQSALEGIIEHTSETELKNKSFTNHQSFRALDFHYTQENDQVQGRLIMVGTTVYRLTVIYPPSHTDKILHEEFLNSFQVQS